MNYITSYNITTDNTHFIIHYQDGSISYLPNNKENEEKLLKIIENSAILRIKDLDIYKKYEKDEKRTSLCYLCGSLYLLCASAYINKNIVKIPSILAGLSFAYGFIKTKSKEYKVNDEIKDIIKYEYFIDNESIINYEIIKRQNEGEDIDLINFNDIAYMDIKELKEVVENISNSYSIPLIRKNKQ